MAEKEIPANKRMIRQGGLMRCCLQTVFETTTPSKIGDVISCKYEKTNPAQMVVAPDGIWEWVQPKKEK